MKTITIGNVCTNDKSDEQRKEIVRKALVKAQISMVVLPRMLNQIMEAIGDANGLAMNGESNSDVTHDFKLGGRDYVVFVEAYYGKIRVFERIA